MKKLLCLMLCVVLVLSLSACTKKLPPADREAIAMATKDIEALTKASADSFPAAEFAFDNETPAGQAKSVENVQIALPYMSNLEGAFWTEDDIAKAGILLRYHKGQYYSMNPREDGSYDIYFFEILSYMGQNTKTLSATDHFIVYSGCIADSEEFFRVARIGATRKQVERCAGTVHEFEDNGMYFLDNGMSVFIAYNLETGKITAEDVTVDDIDNARAIGVGLYPAYLLPQDLALIS